MGPRSMCNYCFFPKTKDYVAVGDFFYGANRITAPGQDLFHETKCVRKDLTAVCTINKKVNNILVCIP